MDIVESLKIKIQEALKALGQDVALNDIVIERSKDLSHGDYATNVAMKMCRLFSKKPVEVASLLIESINKDGIDKIEIAGPGFINFFMKNDSLQPIVKKIIDEEGKFGRAPRNGQKVNVEFVSANPTGILHVGTARGAAVGDSLARLLDASGYDVTKEYYINDAGNQITNLGKSIQVRYQNLFGIEGDVPEDGYNGQDIFDIANKLKEEYGDTLLKKENALEFFKEQGMKIELDRIVEDLSLFRVKHDVFSSEKVIRSNGAVEKELGYLSKYICTFDFQQQAFLAVCFTVYFENVILHCDLAQLCSADIAIPFCS